MIELSNFAPPQVSNRVFYIAGITLYIYHKNRMTRALNNFSYYMTKYFITLDIFHWHISLNENREKISIGHQELYGLYFKYPLFKKFNKLSTTLIVSTSYIGVLL